jgi:spoIIIJ-associated protein
MKNLEIKAKTVDEAIRKALKKLSVKREEIEVTVLKEGKHGILGLGAEETKIRVRQLKDKSNEKANTTEEANGILKTLLSMMGVIASVVPEVEPLIGGEKEAAASLTLNINGDDLGILIGRRGQTLSCLQHIVRLIVGHQTNDWAPITIDVAGYKQRRSEALHALAQRIAEQVKARGVPFTLEPMPAYERRTIHITLTDHPDVITESTGEGEARKVVILPRE